MKLTRPWRIVLEIFAPPPFGVLAFLIYGTAANVLENGVQRILWKPSVDDLRSLAGMLVFSYVFAGFQSLVFAAIMEWRFSRGLSPRSWRTVMLSSALGFVSGVLAGLVAQRPADLAGTIAFFGGVGLFAGFTIGCMIKLGSRSEARASGPV